MQQITRRDFTALVAGAAAASAASGCRSLCDAGGGYSVSVLGDMHYDVAPPETYHAAAIAKWSATGAHPSRLKEFTRNAAMWQGVCGRILDASSRTVRRDAAFALQLGDLVQGDCESDDLHRRMLTEGLGLLERAYPDLPKVTLCGNHDIREGDSEKGAARAYAGRVLPWQAAELRRFPGANVEATTFGFRCGPDLWIVMDFNYADRDMGIVKRLLADNVDARYTFVATHGPVLPMDMWRCRWFYLGAGVHDALRREMRELFAKRRVIVLAGHVHTLELKDWFGDGGRITEIVLNTCAGKTGGGFHPAEPKPFSETPEDFGAWTEGPDAANGLYLNKPLRSAADLKSVYGEYRPGLRRRLSYWAVGHHVLRVSGAGVELDYYGHDSLSPTRTFVLREGRA